jgi:3-oxoacyl-[acyl-carrier protein] reductase
VACWREDAEAADSLLRELKATDGDHHLVRADVAAPEQVAHLLTECGRWLGALDVLVHNAGLISHVPFGELPGAEWHRVVDSNLTAAFLLSQRALPLLHDGSSIVYIGSKVAALGIPLRAHYTAAKAGLGGLARSLAKELGPQGIRVNVVAPGVVDTADEARISPNDWAQMQKRLAQYRKRVPLGRLGRAEDVAHVVLFLASDLACFVTGQTVNVDGGM